MRRQLVPALVAFLALTVLTGVAYPLAVTGVSQVVFPGRADGSLVERDGNTVGSRLIRQQFASPRYFQPRPSAAGDGTTGCRGSASNLGPTNEDYLSEVQKRVAAYRRENRLAADVAVPADAVTASGSGSILTSRPPMRASRRPARRRARGLDMADVLALVDNHTTAARSASSAVPE